MTMSIEQFRAQALNKTMSRRSVGGISKEQVQEAVSLNNLIEFFGEVYDHLDEKIRKAKLNGHTDLETELRNMRAIMRDYEPRPGDDPENVRERMGDLSLKVQNISDKFSGNWQNYIRALSDSLKETSLEGIEDVDFEEPEEEPEEEPGGDFEDIMGLGGEEEEEPEELEEPEEETPEEEESTYSDNNLSESVALVGSSKDPLLKEVARALMSLASQGIGQFTVGSLANQHGYQNAQKIISEAYQKNLIRPVANGTYQLCNHSVIRQMAEEKEIGDRVKVVSGGKEYTGMVKEKSPGGKYKVSFGDEAPEEHDDDREYEEPELGEPE